MKAPAAEESKQGFGGDELSFARFFP